MSLGGFEGGLKYTPSNFLLKYTPNFFGKKAVLRKIFGTSLDFHKSAVKVSKKIFTKTIHEFRGYGGGLKYTPIEFFVQVYIPSNFFWKKAVLRKMFGTSRDFHKSAVKVSKKF